MDNKIFQHILVLQTLIFAGAYVDFLVVNAIFGCCVDRPMGDVSIGHPDASNVVCKIATEHNRVTLKDNAEYI